MKYVCIGI